MKGLKTIVAMALTTMALVGMNGYCAKATTTGNDDTVIVKKSDSEEKKDSLNVENEKNKSDSIEQSKLDELNKKDNNAGKSDSKPENNNQKPAKPVAKPGSETTNTEKTTTKPETNTQGSDESAAKPESNTPNSSEAGAKKEQDTETKKPEMKNEPKSSKTKAEAKSSTVKIVNNSDNAAASVVLTGSDTAVKVFGEKTVNGTTYYKVGANRGVKAEKAHVVAVNGHVSTTKQLPQTGAKNEVIAAVSGLTIASVGIASAMGISRKKKNN